MKRFEVNYNGHTYARNALNFGELTEFGLRVMPIVAGFGATTGVVFANKFEQGDSLHAFYQVIKDVFNKDDWKWLVEMMLHSKSSCLSIDGVDVDENELNEHFAGDFLSVYYVTCEMAWHNLGEFSGLKAKLSGQLGSIADSLKTLVEQQTQMIQDGLEKKQKEKSKE
jgi:hypothetical protein